MPIIKRNRLFKVIAGDWNGQRADSDSLDAKGILNSSGLLMAAEKLSRSDL